jgi:hypothetical protein
VERTLEASPHSCLADVDWYTRRNYRTDKQSVDECIEKYISLAKEVFNFDQILDGIIPDDDDQCRFDHNVLERVLKDIIKQKLGDENTIMADQSTPSCPTFVTATRGLHADGPPVLFRSFKCRGHNADECSIWQAAQATIASPTSFKSMFIQIPPLLGYSFIDGGIGKNNPSELALLEASRIFPKVMRFCLVSIGTGRQHSVRLMGTAIHGT